MSKKPAATSSCEGNPIYPMTGAKVEAVRTGITIGGQSLTLTYHSGTKLSSIADADSPNGELMSFGPAWLSSLHRKLAINPASNSINAMRGDGVSLSYKNAVNGLYAKESDNSDSLVAISGGYRYTVSRDSSIETYNSAGQITGMADARGNTLAFTYSNGYLTQITDNAGRSVKFDYTLPAGGVAATDAKVTKITAPSGAFITAAYDSQANLTSLTWEDGRTRQFLYENAAVPWALTGIVDENNTRYATFGYDTFGRAVSTEHTGGVERVTVTYGVPPRYGVSEVYDPVANVIYRTHAIVPATDPVVTYASGATASLSSTIAADFPRVSGRSQPAGSGCAAASSASTFDSNGNTASRDDFNGTRSCYINDLARNLQTTKVEGLASTVSCGSVTAALSPQPDGSRKTMTQWHPDWPLVSRTAEPGKLTTYVYNGQPDPTASNAVASCAPAAAPMPDGKPIAVLCKQVEQATTDTNGSAGFGASLQAGVAARAASYTYDAAGRVLTSVDANGRGQTYTYYADTAFTGVDPNAVGHTTGDLQSTANAAGHTTTFTLYDKAGRVRQTVDPKGLTTDVAYTPRGWVSTVAVTPPGGSPRSTTYGYDFVGQMTGVAMPDGTGATYSYDAAHRLVGVTDARGNSISYTLDYLGNRIAEEVKVPTGTLQRSVARSFDALNRVQQVTGAAR